MVRTRRLRARRLDLDVEGVVLRLALAAVLLALASGCAADPPDAVVGVAVDGCGPGRTSGSGIVVADDLVLTSAHTLRGAERVVVVHLDRSIDASIVGFDPDLDLAYLQADLDDSIAPIPIAGDALGGRATAWAVRDDEVVEIPVEVVRRIRLETEDIYVDADTTRPAYELRAEIEPGDSGGPVVVDGAVVAVLWARSTREGGVAYAIDAERGSARIDDQLAAGVLGAVDLERCE